MRLQASGDKLFKSVTFNCIKKILNLLLNFKMLKRNSSSSAILKLKRLNFKASSR